nr:hypothetical protein Iba_chr07aCG5440 [Ipomoea batatas]
MFGFRCCVSGGPTSSVSSSMGSMASQLRLSIPLRLNIRSPSYLGLGVAVGPDVRQIAFRGRVSFNFRKLVLPSSGYLPLEAVGLQYPLG